MKHIDLGAHALGLETEHQIRTNQMLQDYNPKLSLRRIPEQDPAAIAGRRFNPPRIFGVWEDGVARGETNWVFTLAEVSIVPDRILTRIFQNDFARTNPKEKFDLLLAQDRAAEALRMKKMVERQEESREDMIAAGKVMRRNGTVRMQINGEEWLVGDTIRPVRTFIV
jgi:hypothetical protein